MRRAGLLAQERGTAVALVHVVDDDQLQDLVALEAREAERILKEQIRTVPELQQVVPVVDRAGHVLGIVTVDGIIDAIVQETTEDVQRFGGMMALEEPYLRIGFGIMIRKRAGWLCALFVSEC